MKTSITTILWGKMHTLSEFRKILDRAKRIGYDGIGLETRLLPHEAIRRPKLVLNALAEARIENAGSYSTMKPLDVAWARESRTPLLWVVARGEKSYDEAIRRLKKLEALAAESKVTLALHNHLGTRFETGQQLERALHQVEGLQLCFDTAHAEACRVDAIDFVRKHHDRIALVHVKDLRERVPKNKVSFSKDFVNVGEGVVDFQGVFAALRDAGYDGHLMLEIEALGRKRPGQLAKEGFGRIKRLLRET